MTRDEEKKHNANVAAMVAGGIAGGLVYLAGKKTAEVAINVATAPARAISKELQASQERMANFRAYNPHDELTSVNAQKMPNIGPIDENVRIFIGGVDITQESREKDAQRAAKKAARQAQRAARKGWFWWLG